MRILLVLANAADKGGPTKYAQNLRPEFESRGHTVEFVTYAPWLWSVPTGLRHLLFAMQLLGSARHSQIMLGFDTMTVGVPLMLVSKLTGTPYCIRIGGDFIWEQYVNKTGKLVKLSDFYNIKNMPLKQRFEIYLTARVLRSASALMFNSNWQRSLWQPVYELNQANTFLVENVYPERIPGIPPQKKTFVASGRPNKLKQEDLLREIFEELKPTHHDIELLAGSVSSEVHQERVRSCYAMVLSSVSDVAPNTIIDAVVYGKPFICAADTGIRERLEGTGLFVDMTDRAALKAAIESLLNPAEYERIAERVRAFTFVRTWREVAGDFLSIMQKL